MVQNQTIWSRTIDRTQNLTLATCNINLSCFGGDQAETGLKFVTYSKLGGKYTTGYVAGKNVR